MSISKDDILNAIAEMSVMDVVELIEAMEEKFGVSAAAAVAADLSSQITHQVYDIQTYGGNLKVSFERHGSQYQNVWLEGPVKHVFDGTINLK